MAEELCDIVFDGELVEAVDEPAEVNTTDNGMVLPYVWTEPQLTTLLDLNRMLNPLREKLPEEAAQKFHEFHITIMFSKTMVSWRDLKLIKMGLGMVHEVYPTRATVFENRDADTLHLVLEVDSESIVKRHEAFKIKGCVPTFEEYRPHITMFSNPHHHDPEMDFKAARTALHDMRDELNEIVKWDQPEFRFMGEHVEPQRGSETTQVMEHPVVPNAKWEFVISKSLL